MEIKVSVIITCYNYGKYLAEAVDSVLASTYENYEIIVIDDGFDDSETVSILEKFSRPKTRIIRQENMGVSAARNNAIKEAKGEYILPLDADDKIAPEYIEKAVDILDSNPEFNVVYCDIQYFGDQNFIFEKPDYHPKILLLENFCTVTSLYKKSDWEKIGGYKKEMDIGWEDWEFWLSMRENYLNPYHIKELLFYYRIIKNENSRNKVTDEIKNRRKLRLKMMKLHPDFYIDNIAYWIFPFLFEFMEEIPVNIKVMCTKKFLSKLFFSKRFFKNVRDVITYMLKG